MGLVYFGLFLMACITFLLAYAYFNDKAESITMWTGLSGKKIIKPKEYKKLQGTYCVIHGVLWLLTLGSIYWAQKIGVGTDVTVIVWRTWLFIMLGAALVSTIHTSKYRA